MKKIKEVFIVTHIHEFGDMRTSIKLIGIYSSRAAARIVITKYKNWKVLGTFLIILLFQNMF